VALKQDQYQSNIEFFDFNRTHRSTALTLKEKIPATFRECWVKIRTIGEFDDTCRMQCEIHGVWLSDSQLKALGCNPPRYRALFAQVVALKLFPYCQAMGICRPDRGDAGDLRHTVEAAYCDMIITRDAAFANMMHQATGILPYKVLTPEAFLQLNG
jgi:hypothetical protein